MALATHYLLWTDGTGSHSYSLEEKQCESAILYTCTGGAGSAKNGGEDYLQLIIQADVDAAELWLYGQMVTLTDSGGVPYFVGWAKKRRPVVQAGRRRHIYIFESADRFLRTTFRQKWAFPASAGELFTAEPELVSLCILFREITIASSTADAQSITVKQQIEDALQYAASYGNAGGAASFGYSLTNIPTLNVPETEKTDPSCAEVLDEGLRYMPCVGRRWNYSTGTPTMSFFSATMTGTPSVAGATSRTLANDGSILKHFDPKPLDDRLVNQVRITYLATEEETVGDRKVAFGTVHRDTATASNGSPISVEISVKLRGQIFNGKFWGSPEVKPPDGLAASLLAGFRRVWWELDFGTHSDDLHWDWQPGDLWNISGSAYDIEAAYSMAQTITRNLKTGEVDVTTGAPTHLGVGDLIALFRPNRLRKAPQNASQQYGFEPWKPQEERFIACDIRWDETNTTTGNVRVKVAPGIIGATVLAATENIGPVANGDQLWAVVPVLYDTATGTWGQNGAVTFDTGSSVPSPDSSHAYIQMTTAGGLQVVADAVVNAGALDGTAQLRQSPITWERRGGAGSVEDIITGPGPIT